MYDSKNRYRSLMDILLDVDILPQPDDITCGPTCLHSIYKYYDDNIPLTQVISEVTSLEEGGTMAVNLACHALKRGYQATIYTFNLQLFDPTWFTDRSIDIKARLIAQNKVKKDPKIAFATEAYLEFLDRGGKVKCQDLSHNFIRSYLKAGKPILTGLSSTYLYQHEREHMITTDHDDIGGYPAGHFVVLCGYSKEERRVTVADPFIYEKHLYEVGLDRLICSIMLGVITYDANLLIIEPLIPRKR